MRPLHAEGAPGHILRGTAGKSIASLIYALVLGAFCVPACGLDISGSVALGGLGARRGAGCAFAPLLTRETSMLNRSGRKICSHHSFCFSPAHNVASTCQASLSAGEESCSQQGAKPRGSKIAAFAAAVLAGSVSLTAPRPVTAILQSPAGFANVQEANGLREHHVGGRLMLAFADEDEDMFEPAVEDKAVALQVANCASAPAIARVLMRSLNRHRLRPATYTSNITLPYRRRKKRRLRLRQHSTRKQKSSSPSKKNALQARFCSWLLGFPVSSAGCFPAHPSPSARVFDLSLATLSAGALESPQVGGGGVGKRCVVAVAGVIAGVYVAVRRYIW